MIRVLYGKGMVELVVRYLRDLGSQKEYAVCKPVRVVVPVRRSPDRRGETNLLVSQSSADQPLRSSQLLAQWLQVQYCSCLQGIARRHDGCSFCTNAHRDVTSEDLNPTAKSSKPHNVVMPRREVKSSTTAPKVQPEISSCQ